LFWQGVKYVNMTKLASVLEGGLAGASTLSLLTNTLRKSSDNNSDTSLFEGKNLKKRFKKAGSKKPTKATGQYVQLAGDLLGSTALFGLSGLQKKKNLMLRGALLGTAAGLGAVLLNEHDKKKEDRDGILQARTQKQEWVSKALEVSLYTIGGLLAAKLIEVTGKKKKGSKKNKKR
jgi:hypothetical protein